MSKSRVQITVKKETLRASGASVWVNCPGSTKIKSGKWPFADNGAAVFGNAVHNAASAILQNKRIELSVQEELQKNERLEDFENYLKFYLNAVENWGLQGGQKIIEQYRAIEFEKYIIAGTMDYAVLICENESVKLQIIDLKTGFVPVDVNDNLQLFVYVHLILLNLPAKFLKNKAVSIESIIVQPAQNIVKMSNISYNPERFKTLYNISNKRE